MLVDVVPVLDVPVAVVQMVDMVPVLDGLAAVTLGVRARVVSVDRDLDVVLATVDMVHMVLVLHGLAAVTGVVLVVSRLKMGHDVSCSWQQWCAR